MSRREVIYNYKYFTFEYAGKLYRNFYPPLINLNYCITATQMLLQIKDLEFSKKCNGRKATTLRSTKNRDPGIVCDTSQHKLQ